MTVHLSWRLIRQTFQEWSDDKISDQAAAVAYYSLFALAPLLIIVVAIVGLFYRDSAVVRDALVNEIGGLIGQQAALTIQQMMAGASMPGRSGLAMVLGIIVLLVSASAVFDLLQRILNTIWKVKPKPGLGIMDMIKTRFFSFAMMLGMGFLLLVSLIVSTAIAALNQLIAGYLPDAEILAHAIDLIISFGIVTLLFAVTYKVVPDATVHWSDVWIGAAVTALLFDIGKFLIGLYLGHSTFASAYGAAGSVLIILVWVYYSAQIVFLGAEFTQVYARRRGSEVRPMEHAMPAE